jgi:HD-GYP domain-containing protein (c-di-GMP phosphodiesterase class II)
MSVPARIMGIADIFEALTSKDRPYKKAKTLTESLEILGRMKVNHHIDPDLFDVFIREKIYLKYAEKFLEPEQIDAVDHAKIPGYIP